MPVGARGSWPGVSGTPLDVGIDWPLPAHPFAVGLHVPSGGCRRCAVSLLRPPPVEEHAMSDSTPTELPSTPAQEPRTLEDVMRGIEPMGDLSRFAIDDLTVDEEAEFYRILEEA